MNIFLCGVRGVGKTTSGEALAGRLGRRFIDSDLEIEKRYQNQYSNKMSYPEIWKFHGEEFFRALEEDVISSFYELKNCVIALGGGTLLSSKNQSTISQLGKIVCLFLNPEELQTRKKGLQKDFSQFYQERMKSFQALSLIWVNADDPKLIEILENIVYGQQLLR